MNVFFLSQQLNTLLVPGRLLTKNYQKLINGKRHDPFLRSFKKLIFRVYTGKMVCSKCRNKHVINLRGYRLKLCREHFAEFYEKKVLSLIKKLNLIKNGEKIAVSFSGGKDSLACLIVLSEIAGKEKFEVYAYHINLGINNYSNQMEKWAKKICNELNITMHTRNLKKTYRYTISDLASFSRKPICSVCGTVKRYLMNRDPRELGLDRVATGHNLDDMIEFAVKNWLNINYDWINKQKPLLPSTHPKILPKIKPLFERTEKENAVYVLIKGFSYPLDECPYAVSSGWKEIAGQIENIKPGFKLRFIKSLEKFNFHSGTKEDFISCRKCGEPSSQFICGFCSLFLKAKKQA